MQREKPATSIPAVLIPFVIYLLTLPRIIVFSFKVARAQQGKHTKF
jgi:hypothetical protein